MRPSALAVLRSSTSSYLVGALTGMSLASRLEDAIDVSRGAPDWIVRIGPVRDQTAIHCAIAERVDRWQLVAGRKPDDQLTTERRSPAVTISPPLLERANAATPRSISPASRTLNGTSSTPSDCATD